MTVAAPRNQNLELVRIISAFGIVQFHAGAPGAEVGFSGLIAFVSMALYFSASSGNIPRTTFRQITSLLRPWAFWWMAYGGLNLVVRGYFIAPDLSWLSGILYGTSQHLWYLPFIFAALLVVEQTRSKFSPRLQTALYGSAGIGMLVLAGIWREPSLALPLPLPQFVHALPAVFLGAAIGFGTGANARGLVATICVLAILAALWVQLPGLTLPYAVGVGGFFLALKLPPLKYDLEPISRCMFGVYLTHVIWLSIFNRITGEHQIVTVIAAFVAATASVWLARRVVPLSRTVIG